jgi:TonB family protein
MAQASASAGIWSDDERQAEFNRRLWLAVASSLVLHVAVLAVVAWVRLPEHGERPLASIEISLASLPTPPVREADPPKTQSKAVEPPPPVKRADPPKIQPKAVEPPPAPPVPVKVPANDILKRLELPPDAPKLGDFSPVEKPVKKQFKLPDVPVVSETRVPDKKLPDLKQQPLLTEDLNKELEEELRNIKKVELPKAAAQESMPKPAPQVEAKAPSIKAVDAALKISGVAPGSNAYLGRVRQRISSFWAAPPVDATAQVYVVIVQFRLHRDGSVTKVEIERSSGNEYYDLAGKRAVLSATPLPGFPPELTESYFDAHFTFTVGDSQG